MKTKFVNLTPHVLHIYDAEGEKVILAIEPSIPAARCAFQSKQVGTRGGVPLFAMTFGEVRWLPAPKKDTIYIVSMLVRNAVPHRTDVASPGELIRDPKGQVIGSKGLAVN